MQIHINVPLRHIIYAFVIRIASILKCLYNVEIKRKVGDKTHLDVFRNP